MSRQNTEAGVVGHTPTPWRVLPEKLYEGQHVAGRSPEIFAGSWRVLTLERRGFKPTCAIAEANAAFIVRAVNSHAALVKIAEDRLADLHQQHHPNHSRAEYDARPDVIETRNALKLAGEKA